MYFNDELDFESVLAEAALSECGCGRGDCPICSEDTEELLDRVTDWAVSEPTDPDERVIQGITERTDENQVEDEQVERAVEIGENTWMFDPISFSESDARLFRRGGRFLLMESDFDAVFNYHRGEKDGYEILRLIAEAHDIDPDDIYLMMTEDEARKAVKESSIKKAVKKPIDGLQMMISRIRARLRKLPPDSMQAKSLRKQLRRLRAKQTLQKGGDVGGAPMY